jgi:hypothetical protein
MLTFLRDHLHHKNFICLEMSWLETSLLGFAKLARFFCFHDHSCRKYCLPFMLCCLHPFLEEPGGTKPSLGECFFKEKFHFPSYQFTNFYKFPKWRNNIEATI